MTVFYSFICNFPWGASWTDVLTAISTAVIGVLGIVITRKQYLIEKHKKDDFLYQHRLEFYNKLVRLLSLDIIKKYPGITYLNIKQEDFTDIYYRFVELQHVSKFLFDNDTYNFLNDIYDNVFEMSNQKLDVTLNVKGRTYLEKLFTEEKLIHFFEKYLRLV